MDAIPSLSSLCLVWLARRLDDIESLEGLPPERSLIVRTRDLDAARPALAALAGVPAGSLRPAHANRGGGEARLAEWVGAERLAAAARSICGPLLQRLDAIAHAPQ